MFKLIFWNKCFWSTTRNRCTELLFVFVHWVKLTRGSGRHTHKRQPSLVMIPTGVKIQSLSLGLWWNLLHMLPSTCTWCIKVSLSTDDNHIDFCSHVCQCVGVTHPLKWEWLFRPFVKCIVSSCFCNKHMCFKNCVYITKSCFLYAPWCVKILKNRVNKILVNYNNLLTPLEWKH